MPDFILIDHCQICNASTQEVLSLGDLPLVDSLIEPSFGTEQPMAVYPTPLRHCPSCQLVQLGCVVDHELRFPLDYPYRSGTTQILRDNFCQLAGEINKLIHLNKKDLVIDIGCNDGTLLDNFKNDARVLGITPEHMGQLAIQKGIEVVQAYFTPESTRHVLSRHGQAMLITATNVLAHVRNIDEVIEDVKQLLKPQGLFVSESGYLFSMLEGLQYDSIHHEHLRYYSLTSLKHLFQKHGLDIFQAKPIDTHGGSIRVYAGHPGQHPIDESVSQILAEEKGKDLRTLLLDFHRGIMNNKEQLHHLLTEIKKSSKTIQGVGAPGRATVLMNFSGIDNRMVDKVVEIQGSYKIGKIIPGTKVNIVAEEEFFIQPPDFCLMLSWHIAGQLMPALKSRGFKGDFILPLPKPVIVSNKDI